MKKEIFSLAFLVIFLSLTFVSANVANVNLNGEEYNISTNYIDFNDVKLQINDQLTKTLNEQTSPYQFYPYVDSVKVGNLDAIISDIFYSSKDTVQSKVSVILAFRVNITEDCSENWNCSDWGSCSNNQQTRTCTDLSSCGTTTNEPVETRGCGSPNPSIECYNDNDCMMPSMGSPYCEGSSQCIGYLSYKCIKAGTTESYCNSTSMKNCNICPNGCENNICINQSQPVKECDTIGLRQSGKYCSTEYKLINSKSDSVSCENNFECKINSCLDSKCGKEQSSKLIYWILGIVAVLIIIGLIIYFLKPKSE